MTGIWAQAALWLGLALAATLLSIWFWVATALSEIVVGTIAQLIIGALLGSALLVVDASWIKFPSGAGAVVFFVLPWIVPRFFKRYGGRPSELEAKFLLACLLGMGALATWADSEAVLPAYLIS
ncbi:MAG: hypothetical protein ACLQHK_11925 [Gallionellaceae bacterium]